MRSKNGEGIVDRLLTRPFEEAVVLLVSVLAVGFLVPFSVVRAVEGAWVHAALDLVVASLALGIGWFARRTGRIGYAAPTLVGVFTVTLVLMVYLFGTGLLFWAYPVTTATFFLLSPRVALRVNAATFLAIIPGAVSLGDWLDIAGFIAPLAANNVLALIFAAGMRQSRTHLRLMAERDALTGAGNRRAFEPALAAALDKSVEQGIPMSLIAMDVDHFKRVNDRHGHETGDRVLVEVTRLIESSVRTNDGVFRYGGEEFVVIADGADRGGAARLAEKIRRHIHDAPMDSAGPISLSIGVAEARPDDSPGSWFRRTDVMLYRAKADGRNRVCVEPAND